eukprot:5494340-Amphidinium_carterae.1
MSSHWSFFRLLDVRSTFRIGAAKNPGPTICSVKTGGWSCVTVTGTRTLHFDIVAVQETFLQRDAALARPPFTAKQQVYYSAFTPARKTGGGRGPMERVEQGEHWEAGRWAHHLLPFDQGLHIFNVYGYSSDHERSPELTRELCIELFSAVAALGNRKIFAWVLGDWNFAPDEFPMDLVNGVQAQSTWIGFFAPRLPACDLEQATEKKPDHVAIKMDFQLELVSQGYLGQKSCETAEYQKERDKHLARRSAALMRQDVDELWNLWRRASEQALGLPALSRGNLLKETCAWQKRRQTKKRWRLLNNTTKSQT